MAWLMFGAGWVTGWLVLGLFAFLVAAWAMLAERMSPPTEPIEADAHERLTWPAERCARNGAHPWQS